MILKHPSIVHPSASESRTVPEIHESRFSENKQKGQTGCFLGGRSAQKLLRTKAPSGVPSEDVGPLPTPTTVVID